MTVACYKDFSIAVNAGCDASTDWLHNPGPCRLRIKSFVAGDWANSTLCLLARLGVVMPWDGTFSKVVPVVVPTPGNSYEIDLVSFQTLGGVYLGSPGTSFLVFNNAFPRWNIQISYMDTGLGDQNRWSGFINGTSPLGVYTRQTRCNIGLPNSIEIEGYSL